MNLRKKKLLAAKTLNVGKKRIVFVKPRLEEIKEAITKRDILDLHKEGAIIIKNVVGRKRKLGKKIDRGAGKKRKSIQRRKEKYVILTRKLRKYVFELVKNGGISLKEAKDLRKGIRNKMFRSKSHLKEQIKEIKNEKIVNAPIKRKK